jgi:hypothetical protein
MGPKRECGTYIITVSVMIGHNATGNNEQSSTLLQSLRESVAHYHKVLRRKCRSIHLFSCLRCGCKYVSLAAILQKIFLSYRELGRKVELPVSHAMVDSDRIKVTFRRFCDFCPEPFSCPRTLKSRVFALQFSAPYLGFWIFQVLGFV